ncbi:hypothetical protein T492DRAFT_843798 [Pavlovales sp. CCMP2436]|nr:hypothetical protein T492DRAFT_843798 [Pavlovales sp. CCMP2436]
MCRRCCLCRFCACCRVASCSWLFDTRSEIDGVGAVEAFAKGPEISPSPNSLIREVMSTKGLSPSPNSLIREVRSTEWVRSRPLQRALRSNGVSGMARLLGSGCALSARDLTDGLRRYNDNYDEAELSLINGNVYFVLTPITDNPPPAAAAAPAPAEYVTRRTLLPPLPPGTSALDSAATQSASSLARAHVGASSAASVGAANVSADAGVEVQSGIPVSAPPVSAAGSSSAPGWLAQVAAVVYCPLPTGSNPPPSFLFFAAGQPRRKIRASSPQVKRTAVRLALDFPTFSSLSHFRADDLSKLSSAQTLQAIDAQFELQQALSSSCSR